MGLLAALVVIANMGLIYAEITCEAPAVITGDPAYIICLFDVDVSVAKKNIKVQRRSLTSARFDPDKTDTVLDCYWQNAADFSCQFGNGFKLVGEAGRMALVRIGKASKNDEQVYMCEVVPSDPTNIQTCTLSVRDPSAYDGNFSHVNVVHERLEDDTVKGIVTAIIIIMCIIVMLVLVVLLICFRKQLKDNLQRCYTRWSPCAASPTQGKKGDPESAHQSSASTDHTNNEVKATEDLNEKQKIERYIQHLLTIKKAGGLNEFYQVSHITEKENATGTAETSNRRHTYSVGPEGPSEVVSGRSNRASKAKVMPGFCNLQELIEHKLPTDPEGLHITVKEWHEREQAEIDRKKEEVAAEKVLYEVRETNAKSRRKEIDKYLKKGITDIKEDSKQRKKGMEKAQKENAAAYQLKNIKRRHDEERKRQKEQDMQRLERAKELMIERSKRSPSEEDTRARLLRQLSVTDAADDKDTAI